MQSKQSNNECSSTILNHAPNEYNYETIFALTLKCIPNIVVPFHSSKEHFITVVLMCTTMFLRFRIFWLWLMIWINTKIRWNGFTKKGKFQFQMCAFFSSEIELSISLGSSYISLMSNRIIYFAWFFLHKSHVIGPYSNTDYHKSNLMSLSTIKLHFFFVFFLCLSFWPNLMSVSTIKMDFFFQFFSCLSFWPNLIYLFQLLKCISSSRSSYVCHFDISPTNSYDLRCRCYIYFLKLVNIVRDAQTHYS